MSDFTPPETRDQIYDFRLKLMRRMQAAKGELNILNAEMQNLQRWCTHPEKFTYSAMGEKGERCNDCGWQT
jgi:predicted adenine nucleotide alpha hydrolase (AANH) superfamily ATPase